MMNRRLLPLLLLAALTVPVAGQELLRPERPDTTTLLRMTLTDPERFSVRPSLLVPSFGHLDPEERPSRPVGLRTALLLEPGLNGQTAGEAIPLLGTLQMKWDREDGLSLIRTVLGTVEACGTAYAAYRAVKKYGLK